MDEFYRVIAEGGAGHTVSSLGAATELAESLSRHGWVEIVHHYEDGDGEPTWKVVAELAASRG